MTSVRGRDETIPSAAPADALDLLMRLGASMLQAGGTADRTRRWIDAIAPKLGFEAVSVAISLDTITVSGRLPNERRTAMLELRPPGIDVSRLARLEGLARKLRPETTLADIARELADVEAAPRWYSVAQVAAAVGLASGGFAFLNGAAAPETLAAALGGGCGQWARAWLSRRGLNQYGVAALSAIAASGVYVLAAAFGSHLGFGFTQYPAGFIGSVLFLVPGFPLIAALFDLLQHHTVAALSRLAYGVMMLLAVAFGLSVVIAVAGVEVSRPPPLALPYLLLLLLRGVASFAAATALAMLFNSSPRTALAAGLLALGANELRLVLHDFGLMLAPAAFVAASTIGLVAVAAERGFDMPRIGMVVAPILIMVPGLYAFEMIVWFNRGQMLEALQASASCGFITGALAMGLAGARFFAPR